MGRWLRRIRGAMGLAFGATADVPFPLGFGLLGFFAGVTFSGVVGILGGRRRFDEMSLPRFTGWGAAGGFLLSTIFVSVVTLVDDPTFMSNLVFLGPIFAVAGAGCAAGSLALARKAEDRGLLDTGADVAEVGLSKEEERELLGDGD